MCGSITRNAESRGRGDASCACGGGRGGVQMASVLLAQRALTEKACCGTDGAERGHVFARQHSGLD